MLLPAAVLSLLLCLLVKPIGFIAGLLSKPASTTILMLISQVCHTAEIQASRHDLVTNSNIYTRQTDTQTGILVTNHQDKPASH